MNPAAKSLMTAMFVAGCALALSGCFDLAQTLSIDRGGSGRYVVAITATGLLGEALRDNRSRIRFSQNRVKTNTTSKDGKVTQTAIIDFRSLSDLRLSDELVSLSNHGASWLGFGPNHVSFRRTLLVDRARRENAPRSAEAERFGGDLLQTMFGDHIYLFSVAVPGSVDRAAPIRIGHGLIKPEITADGLGHRITWRMPLYTLLQAKLVTFAVDFSAYGSFPDAQSQPANPS